MRVLICPDKFKGSLSALDVCHAIKSGLQNIDPDIDTELVPLADGGEGTCNILTRWSGGTTVQATVTGPRFNKVSAEYGLSPDGFTAFIEMSSASGLVLLEEKDRNPLYTTSLGTGELIAHAMKQKAQTVILGLGGSATNDAGVGMAAALGYKFFDVDKNAIEPVGKNLERLHTIDSLSVNSHLMQTKFIALCDVTNPLYGPNGAAFIYGPQKGADAKAVEMLDGGLRKFSEVVARSLNRNSEFPGAGAAGGLGAGAKVFLNATIQNGIDYVAQHTGLAEKMVDADLIITGEGRIDAQSFSGKVISKVIALGKGLKKPIIAVCGSSDVPTGVALANHLTKIVTLTNSSVTKEQAMRDASSLIAQLIDRELRGFVTK